MYGELRELCRWLAESVATANRVLPAETRTTYSSEELARKPIPPRTIAQGRWRGVDSQVVLTVATKATDQSQR